MKVVRTSKDRLTVHLNKREKEMLMVLSRLYPRVPPAHCRLSRSESVPQPEAAQRLLDEALAEQRAESKKRLETFLRSSQRFREYGTGGVQFSLSPPEAEWLLQVLNDVRVGSWVLLGSPEEKIQLLNEKTVPHVWAMEMAGYFQMRLLEAMDEASET
ncbi:MAG: hypothetical protein C5B50_09865 [Verrucomicrobia bacterium]|nr:MAG: hypothetical protein C5B50_09865 [Verrucomicrobiota bacterium]